jgi:hypothetical protein
MKTLDELFNLPYQEYMEYRTNHAFNNFKNNNLDLDNILLAMFQAQWAREYWTMKIEQK